MSTNVVSRLSQGQLRAFEQALEAAEIDIEESWKSEDRRAAVARDLEGIVRHCLQIPKTLENVWHYTFAQIQAHQIHDYNITGHELRESFDPGLRIMARVLDLVTAFERLGGHVHGAEQLREADCALRRLESQVFEHWPWFSEADAREAMAEIQRGDYLELDDAFAQIASCDKETWLRRVEERKKTFKT